MSLSLNNNDPLIGHHDGFQINQVTWDEAKDELRGLREEIFIHEQNVPTELEWDGKDKNCMHLLARDNNGRAIGTSRMTDEGHIGRMAVLISWRNKGVGGAMLTALITLAQKRRLPHVQLDAQVQAIEFYRKLGFEIQGNVFMDANIPHQHMVRKLSAVAKD